MMDWMAQYGDGDDDDGDDDVTLGELLDSVFSKSEPCNGQHDCPCGAVFDDVPPARVNVDGLRPLRAHALHCVGHAWSAGVASDVYVVDGVRCSRDAATDAVWYGFGDAARVRVWQPAILRAIARRIAHDRAVQDARDAYAVTRAGGDPILATVLRTHLWYACGVCHEPVVRDGIAFYAVGRNASHEFSLGVRDGQRYVRSFCGEDGDDAERTRAVPTWDGCYLGHA